MDPSRRGNLFVRGTSDQEPSRPGELVETTGLDPGPSRLGQLIDPAGPRTQARVSRENW